MKDKPAKKVAAKKSTSKKVKDAAKDQPDAAETETILTEVPPIEEGELFTEVPPEEVPTEGAEVLVEEVPLLPSAPFEPFVGPTPPSAPKRENKAPSTGHYTSAQLKKLRGEYSRRTLQTRFGITF